MKHYSLKTAFFIFGLFITAQTVSSYDCDKVKLCANNSSKQKSKCVQIIANDDL